MMVGWGGKDFRWGCKVRYNTWGGKVRCNSAAENHPSARHGSNINGCGFCSYDSAPSSGPVFPNHPIWTNQWMGASRPSSPD